MRKQQIAIIVLAVWLTFIAIFMLLAQSVSFGLFFLLSLTGFLVIVELTPRPVLLPGNRGTKKRKMHG